MRLIGVALGLFLKLLHGVFGELLGRQAVGLDGLLGDGGQLRLPVALALLLLLHAVLLVLLKLACVGIRCRLIRNWVRVEGKGRDECGGSEEGRPGALL